MIDFSRLRSATFEIFRLMPPPWLVFGISTAIQDIGYAVLINVLACRLKHTVRQIARYHMLDSVCECQRNMPSARRDIKRAPVRLRSEQINQPGKAVSARMDRTFYEVCCMLTELLLI